MRDRTKIQVEGATRLVAALSLVGFFFGGKGAA